MRRETFHCKVSMSKHWTFTLLFAAVLWCGTAGKAEGNLIFQHLFGIGDSYIDTGNRNPTNGTETPVGPVNQPWKPPYGSTLPPFTPTGRFSDGLVFFDKIASFLGLAPVTYRIYAANAPSATLAKDGVNFAVGGAGVFNTTLGFTKTGDQITELQNIIATPGVYDGQVYSQSLILYVLAGNDYFAYVLQNGINITGLGQLVPQVVGQIVADILRLYSTGFRNFAVSTLEPGGCLPTETIIDGYTACIPSGNAVADIHNALLLAELPAALPQDANLIFLDLGLTFTSILNGSIPSVFSAPILRPCCIPTLPNGLCGDVNSGNQALYTVCFSRFTTFFWDNNHPTSEGWNLVWFLLLVSSTYTRGKSLLQFLLL